MAVLGTVGHVRANYAQNWQSGKRPPAGLPRARRPLAGQPHVDRLACRAHVRFAAPQSYTLDGDLFRSTEIELAIGPRLRVAMP